MKNFLMVSGLALVVVSAMAQGSNEKTVYVLKAARMLDVRAGKVVSPGEVVVQGTTLCLLARAESRAALR